MHKAYCFHCKKKVEISGGHHKKIKGHNFILGKCKNCGNKVSAITK